MRKLTETQLGLIFLIPGLIISVPALLTGNFQGAIMGAGFFACVFGGLMVLVGLSSRTKSA